MVHVTVIHTIHWWEVWISLLALVMTPLEFSTEVVSYYITIRFSVTGGSWVHFRQTSLSRTPCSSWDVWDLDTGCICDQVKKTAGGLVCWCYKEIHLFHVLGVMKSCYWWLFLNNCSVQSQVIEWTEAPPTSCDIISIPDGDGIKE